MESDEEGRVSLIEVKEKIPCDSYNLAYISYFILGTGYLLPWNTFITAVDYFQYVYPDRSVDRTFVLVSQLVMLITVLLLIFCFRKSHSYIRVNLGLCVFLLALFVVPIMDIMGLTRLCVAFYITVGAVSLSAAANALVETSLIGSAGELPDRYMQALFSGTGASGVLVSFLRIFTKAIYPQDTDGLRSSAMLYFIVGIVLMMTCIILYNVAHRLPVIKYYSEMRTQAATNEMKDAENSSLSGCVWEIMVKIKWYGMGVILIYVVSLSIFPGFITEDVHSEVLGNWYGILLITCFNVFDLVGKSLTAIYLLDSSNGAIAACLLARLLFYPLYLGCLHGPQLFRTEIPVTLLTCLLGLTNGYFTSVMMILSPKTVPLPHAETAGILIALFLFVGLAAGSIVSWFWVF